MVRSRGVLILSLLVLMGCAAMEEKPLKVTVEELPAEPAEEVPTEKILRIANFNAGIKPNLLGGDFGAWDKDTADMTQTCVEAFDSDVKVGDKGFSMKLIYDVDSPNPAFNGFWLKLQDADFTDYKKICFSVKGGETTGFTKEFKVELKNAKGEVGNAIVSGITDQWQVKSILFSEFTGISNFSQMSEFIITFDDQLSNPKTGVIYIDNIFVE